MKRESSQSCSAAKSKLFHSIFSFHLLVKRRLKESEAVWCFSLSAFQPAEREKMKCDEWRKQLTLPLHSISPFLFSAGWKAGWKREKRKVKLFCWDWLFGLVFPLRSWRPAPNRRRQNNQQTQSQRQWNSSQESKLFCFPGLDCSLGERQHSQTNFSFNNHLSSCGLLNGWFALLLAQPLWNAAKKESLLLLRRKRRAFFYEKEKFRVNEISFH